MDLYQTETLIGVIDGLDKPVSPLLDLFFPNTQTFETEEVYLDKLDRARRLAPFVSPVVEGKIMRNRGFTTSTFKPAYVKPKHKVEPGKAMKRAAGERIGGGQISPEQKFAMAVTQNLADEDDQITRREEWMASEILRKGQVTVAGDDFPTMLVDFARDAALTVALSGGARWGQSGVSVLANLRTWAASIASKSGANATQVVMDPLAALLLQQDTEVRAILNNWRQASGKVELSPLVTGAQGEEVAYIGTIGNYDFWQYQQLYTDDAGTEQKMMPDNTVILGAPSMAEGIRTYGAIQDKKAGLQALKRFPKMWDTDDPSSTTTMTQSAPLPVLGRPNATFCATVN